MTLKNYQEKALYWLRRYYERCRVSAVVWPSDYIDPRESIGQQPYEGGLCHESNPYVECPHSKVFDFANFVKPRVRRKQPRTLR